MIQIIDNWQDLPFSKYLELSFLPQSNDDLTNLINTISILSGLPVEEVSNIKAKEFTKYSAKAGFLSTVPPTEKGTLKWKFKKIEDITMDEFIAFEKMKSLDENIPNMLSFLTKNKVEEAEILNMSTLDVLNGFFLLRQHLTFYIKRSLTSLMWIVMKQKVKDKFLFWGKRWQK